MGHMPSSLWNVGENRMFPPANKYSKTKIYQPFLKQTNKSKSKSHKTSWDEILRDLQCMCFTNFSSIAFANSY